jgi:hypothetical protein
MVNLVDDHQSRRMAMQQAQAQDLQVLRSAYSASQDRLFR